MIYFCTVTLSFLPIHPSISPSTRPYLLQLSGPGAHKHHSVFSVGVCGHSSHSVCAVLVQRVSLDDPHASERLVQHQAAEVVPDLNRLWRRGKGGRSRSDQERTQKQEAGSRLLCHNRSRSAGRGGSHQFTFWEKNNLQ